MLVKARVEVSFRAGVLDPEAQAIHRALGGMGFEGVQHVRRAKVIEVDLTASDRASIRATQEAIDEAFRGAGLGHVELMLGDEHPPMLLEGIFHHLGTTRMHTDPTMGVVDADCRVHGVRNLYVAGSSVFPTYGCSNPTLTVVALALRLADHLKKQLAG